MTNLRHGLDTRACLGDAETVSGEYLLIALRMQLRESGTELKLLSVDRQGTVGTFLALHSIGRQTLGIDTKEITHARMLEIEESCYPVKTHYVHDVVLHRSEDPLQHVVEMHTDVRSDAAALVHIAFPRGVVPFAATRNIRQVHVVDLVLRSVCHFLFERTNLLMQTQLQDRVGLMTRLGFQLHQVIDVVGVEHQGFLTDYIASQTQTVADERIVRVVRRTDRQPM